VNPLPEAPGQLHLLSGVSRSFYLSVRLLPAPLRQPIAVAYLLARATDTVADTAGLPLEQKLNTLQTMAAAIDGDTAAHPALAGALASFAPNQQEPAEEALLRSLPQCLIWLDELQAADRDDVRQVVRTITGGQMLDVQRFDGGTGVRALATADELRDYTWRVAGCVGEFWTQLGFRHLPGFASLPRGAMLGLGKRYGMGLQLINILRDVEADLAQGRCYLPADELAAAGLTPQQVACDPSLLEPVARRWRTEAGQLLDSGIEYAAALRNRRVRAASALPALIGAPTLALLQTASRTQSTGKVKVSRGQVRVILAVLALTLAAPAPMRLLYHRLRA
ncbi:MAG: squalene/phytoene synthase family protein, partial [Ramlibacter sp.]